MRKARAASAAMDIANGAIEAVVFAHKGGAVRLSDYITISANIQPKGYRKSRPQLVAGGVLSLSTVRKNSICLHRLYAIP